MGKRKLQPLRKSNAEKFSKAAEKASDVEIDSEAEWEKVERDGNIEVDESDDDIDSDSDSDGEINLEGDKRIQDESKYTFEFNDLKEDYTESITTLFKGKFCNGTMAYEAACTISAQGKIFNGLDDFS